VGVADRNSFTPEVTDGFHEAIAQYSFMDISCA